MATKKRNLFMKKARLTLTEWKTLAQSNERQAATFAKTAHDLRTVLEENAKTILDQQVTIVDRDLLIAALRDQIDTFRIEVDALRSSAGALSESATLNYSRAAEAQRLASQLAEEHTAEQRKSGDLEDRLARCENREHSLAVTSGEQRDVIKELARTLVREMDR